MDIHIQLTNAGLDISNVTLSYYVSPGPYVVFDTGVSKIILLAGVDYTIPDGSTFVKITSTGLCDNEVIIPIVLTTTTTSTTTTEFLIPAPSLGVRMNMITEVPSDYSITQINFKGDDLLLSTVYGDVYLTQQPLSVLAIGSGTLIASVVGAAPDIYGDITVKDSDGNIYTQSYVGSGDYTFTTPDVVINGANMIFVELTISNNTTTTTTTTTTSTSTTTSTTSTTSSTTSTTTTAYDCGLISEVTYSHTDTTPGNDDGTITLTETGSVVGLYRVFNASGWVLIATSPGTPGSPFTFTDLPAANYYVLVNYDYGCNGYIPVTIGTV